MGIPRISDSVLRRLLEKNTVTYKQRSRGQDDWGDPKHEFTDYTVKLYLHTLTLDDTVNMKGGEYEIGDAKIYCKQTMTDVNVVANTVTVAEGDEIVSGSDRWEILKVNTWRDFDTVFVEAYLKRRVNPDA